MWIPSSWKLTKERPDVDKLFPIGGIPVACYIVAQKVLLCTENLIRLASCGSGTLSYMHGYIRAMGKAVNVIA